MSQQLSNEELWEKLQRLTELNKTLTQVIDQQNEDIKELTLLNDALSSENQLTIGMISEKNEEIERLERQNEELQTCIAVHINVLDASARQTEQLTDEKKKLTDEKLLGQNTQECLSELVLNLMADLKKSQIQNQLLTERNKGLKDECAALAKLSYVDLGLSSDTNDFASRIASAKNEIRHLRENIDSLEQTLRVTMEELDQKTKDFNQMKPECEDLRALVCTRDSQIDALNKELDICRSITAGDMMQYGSCDSMKSTDGVGQSLEERFAELQSSMSQEDLRGENERLREEIEDLREELQRFKQINADVAAIRTQ